ncbi:MAG: hypothetical protein AABX94_04570 [Nanoarchaeota archaeon]
MNFKIVFMALIVLALSFVSAQVSSDQMFPVTHPVLVEEPEIEDPIQAVDPNSVSPVLVEEPPIVVNTNTGGNPSNSNNNDDEGNGRRAGAGLPLTPLSTTPGNQGSSESGEDNSQFSGITGAVVGLFGEKGALGVGIFLVVVGLVALTVYNRAFLGLVKAK